MAEPAGNPHGREALLAQLAEIDDKIAAVTSAATKGPVAHAGSDDVLGGDMRHLREERERILRDLEAAPGHGER